jgi:DnaK suppressor protein
MGNQTLRRYRSALNDVIRSDGPVPAKPEEPFKSPELEEEAAVGLVLYVESVDEAIRWSHQDAARKALERLQEGSFGICVECCDAISPKRLAAVPWAERCLRCQGRVELREALGKCA